MRIRPATPEDASALTEIAFAAKRHWNYPADWIQRWQDLLTITPEYVLENRVLVAVSEDEGQMIGFSAVSLQGEVALLDHLWVLPAFMGKGAGRALFSAAERAARESAAVRMTILSDPHAEPFYLRMGAVLCGRESASMDGEERYLPLLGKAL